MRQELLDIETVASAQRLTDVASINLAGEDANVFDATPFISMRVLSSLVRIGEGLIVFLSGLVIWLSYLPSAESIEFYLPAICAISLAVPAVFHMARLYELGTMQRTLTQVTRLSIIWIVLFGMLSTLLFVTKYGEEYSRVWFLAWYGVGFVLLLTYRLIFTVLVRRWNRNGQLLRRVVLVGGGAPAEELIKAIRGSKETDVQVVGIFDDRSDDRSPMIVAGIPKLGTINELIDFVRRSRVDLMVVTFPLTAESRLVQVLHQLWVLPVDIRLSAYMQKVRYRPRAYSYIGNVPFLDVFDKPLTDWGSIMKAAEDKIFAALALALLSPAMLLIALAIKLESKGPVFFRQNRYGFNNELIQVLKFRSMYVEATDSNASKLVSKDDPRVTRVGRFIRKTSLDELPQLINVLKGDLSLVGPRPHATLAKAGDQLYDEVVEEYFARHRVKPGITGWAQINGWRGETDTADKIHRRVEHDLYYIENWSLAFDLYILAKTPFALLNTENAY